MSLYALHPFPLQYEYCEPNAEGLEYEAFWDSFRVDVEKLSNYYCYEFGCKVSRLKLGCSLIRCLGGDSISTALGGQSKFRVIMLAGHVAIKGIKYNVQFLLNGWVLSALLWCIGSGLQSVSESIADGWIPLIGAYVVYAGWGCGFVSAIIFAMLMCRYWWARRAGKIL